MTDYSKDGFTDNTKIMADDYFTGGEHNFMNAVSETLVDCNWDKDESREIASEILTNWQNAKGNNTMIDKPINALDLSAEIVKAIDTNGRLGLSELIANVKPESWTKNDFIRLIKSMCDESHNGINSYKIMASSIDSGGPRYQMFTFAFTPAIVDYNDYLDVVVKG